MYVIIVKQNQKRMYDKPKDNDQVEKTISALKANGMEAILAKDREEVKAKVLEMIPADASVMTMTSVTLDALGIAEEINGSGKFKSVRTQFAKMNPNEDATKMREMATAPDYTVGSVHAVTKDGKVMIVSNTGSQLPAYAYGAGKVIWVVGTQKIVKNIDEAFKRIQEYVLPLESDRANKAYNITTGSFISKELVINREITKGRITIIFVPENIGF